MVDQDLLLNEKLAGGHFADPVYHIHTGEHERQDVDLGRRHLVRHACAVFEALGRRQDADAQLGVLNALCDVAELAEEMGSTRGLPESVMETAAPAEVFLSELGRVDAGS